MPCWGGSETGGVISCSGELELGGIIYSLCLWLLYGKGRRSDKIQPLRRSHFHRKFLFVMIDVMTNTVICLDVEGNKYEIPLEELQWRPSVYGIVIKNDKVLLSKQFGDRYDLPGGGVDLGEDLKAAVVREVKEETGLDVHKPEALGIENNFFHSAHGNKQSYHSILVYYSCILLGGELSIDGFDEEEKKYAEIAEWVPLDTIDDLKLASTFDFRPYIKQAAQF